MPKEWKKLYFAQEEDGRGKQWTYRCRVKMVVDVPHQ